MLDKGGYVIFTVKKMALDQVSFIQPTIFPKNIIAAESTRHGGVSLAPYHSLNLGLFTEDQEEYVRENRKRFFEGLGIKVEQVAGSYQIHGKEVAILEQAKQLEGFDALVSNKKQLFLSVTIADCTPVLLYDSVKEVVAAIHAGWRGTTAQIVKQVFKTMQEHFGTEAKDCYAYIGSCIDACDFEVDADVADYFEDRFKNWDEEKRKFFVDLKESNKVQLEQVGVPTHQIETSPYSTVQHNEHFFSHRKENGQTGRSLAIIGMK